MSFEEVKKILTTRLDNCDRGDRGWFVVTRVHVEISWLRATTQYIEARGSGSSIELSSQDYRRLAEIIGISSTDPGNQLRRHHLLLMDQPLKLIKRVKKRSWREIELTQKGKQLAQTNDPSAVMEKILSSIRFAVPPWYSEKRSEQYSDFDVQLYVATYKVLKGCSGYIDRDEFDFFVSRIRNMQDITWASDAIKKYRNLKVQEQTDLRAEVRNRIPNKKEYRNWRDMALHTFTLFSLGTTMIHDGNFLYLTEHWSNSTSTIDGSNDDVKSNLQLKMPSPSESEALLQPPVPPISNDGTDAESFVAKIFRAQGWSVTFYTNRRGFGFDLWARKGNDAVVIEVKSSVGQLSSINLTKNEFKAARQYGENFVLALVENLDSDEPKLYLIENPEQRLTIREQSKTVHVISRSEWIQCVAAN